MSNFYYIFVFILRLYLILKQYHLTQITIDTHLSSKNKVKHIPPINRNKMKVFYSRISSVDQNAERQLQNTNDYDYVLTDKCSGFIPLWQRPHGKTIKQLIDAGKLKHLEIHNIDRLGRNTIDVLSVWKELTELGITIVCRNPSIRNFNERGEPDIFSDLIISILSTMGEFEKNIIKERQLEGIKIRKTKGLYVGRKIGTTESKEKFLNKQKTKLIIEYLNKNYKHREIAKICNCSTATINKTLKLIKEIHKE